jgi:hypothetical protein
MATKFYCGDPPRVGPLVLVGQWYGLRVVGGAG